MPIEYFFSFHAPYSPTSGKARVQRARVRHRVPCVCLLWTRVARYLFFPDTKETLRICCARPQKSSGTTTTDVPIDGRLPDLIVRNYKCGVLTDPTKRFQR